MMLLIAWFLYTMAALAIVAHYENPADSVAGMMERDK
jgi:hypothetical protein